MSQNGILLLRFPIDSSSGAEAAPANHGRFLTTWGRAEQWREQENDTDTFSTHSTRTCMKHLSLHLQSALLELGMLRLQDRLVLSDPLC
jgi:hypothetical protein